MTKLVVYYALTLSQNTPGRFYKAKKNPRFCFLNPQCCNLGLVSVALAIIPVR